MSPPTISTCPRSSSSKAPSRPIQARSSWSPTIAGCWRRSRSPAGSRSPTATSPKPAKPGPQSFFRYEAAAGNGGPQPLVDELGHGGAWAAQERADLGGLQPPCPGLGLQRPGPVAAGHQVPQEGRAVAALAGADGDGLVPGGDRERGGE